MKKPKWRKYKGGWKRGVLEVFTLCEGIWEAYGADMWLSEHPTPEAAMKAADEWWERTRRKMEGN